MEFLLALSLPSQFMFFDRSPELYCWPELCVSHVRTHTHTHTHTHSLTHASIWKSVPMHTCTVSSGMHVCMCVGKLVDRSVLFYLDFQKVVCHSVLVYVSLALDTVGVYCHVCLEHDFRYGHHPWCVYTEPLY